VTNTVLEIRGIGVVIGVICYSPCFAACHHYCHKKEKANQLCNTSHRVVVMLDEVRMSVDSQLFFEYVNASAFTAMFPQNISLDREKINAYENYGWTI
jgi:hypothetical protein